LCKLQGFFYYHLLSQQTALDDVHRACGVFRLI